jgi:hypothetical protein
MARIILSLFMEFLIMKSKLFIAASFIAGTAFTAQAASTTLTVSGGTIQFLGLLSMRLAL